MTAEGYQKIERWMRRRSRLLSVMKALNHFLPLLLYIAYPVLLIVLAVSWDSRFWKVLLIPATVFLLVTVLRKVINARRPYEVLDISPLIFKEKSGESFPSRHVASAFILMEAFWYISLPLGIFTGIAAVLIALIRLLAGIHFPRDVIAGALFSLVLGIPGFLFLPI